MRKWEIDWLQSAENFAQRSNEVKGSFDTGFGPDIYQILLLNEIGKGAWESQFSDFSLPFTSDTFTETFGKLKQNSCF